MSPTLCLYRSSRSDIDKTEYNVMKLSKLCELVNYYSCEILAEISEPNEY